MGGILGWAAQNNICGPSYSIIVIVGWNMYAPPAFNIYGCNPGASGVSLPQLCVCH